MSRGNYISRVCVIHINSSRCLYDRIRPDCEDLWMSSDEKYDEDAYAMNIKFPVSGTKKERSMRDELIKLLKSFSQISRSIDTGAVFKAAFQKPAENRQSNFTVKFTPHFGTLARPKKAINTKISSMVFGQAQTEMVMATKQIDYQTRKEKQYLKKAKAMAMDSNGDECEEKETNINIAQNNKSNKNNAHGEFVCAIFYGINCKPETATNLAKKLIDEFFQRFSTALQRFLSRLDDTNEDEESNDDEDCRPGAEYIMAQFKSFDEIVDRLATRNVDRRDRKMSSRRLYKINKKPFLKNNNTLNTNTNTTPNTVTSTNSEILESKSEDDDADY